MCSVDGLNGRNTRYCYRQRQIVIIFFLNLMFALPCSNYYWCHRRHPLGTAGGVGLLQQNEFLSTFFHWGNYTQCLLSIQKGYPSHLSSSRKRTHSPPRETTLIWVFAEKGKITILNIYFRNNGNLCSKLFGLSNVFLILPSSRLYTIYKGAITISYFLTINT